MSCKSCKKMNDKKKKEYQIMLKRIESGPRINYTLTCHDFKNIKELINRDSSFENSFKFNKSYQPILHKFSLIYFENEIDSSVNNFLDIFNLFQLSLNKKQLNSISPEFLILSCFFLIMRSKYNIENSNVHFKFFYEPFGIKESDLPSILQLELLIFYSFGFVVPKSNVIDIFLTLSAEYFFYLKVIKRKKIRGSRNKGNTNCYARQAVVLNCIKFYCFLLQEQIDTINIDSIELYFLIFYTIINKLNEIDENAHYSITALFLLMEGLECNVDFEDNKLERNVEEHFKRMERL